MHQALPPFNPVSNAVRCHYPHFTKVDTEMKRRPEGEAYVYSLIVFLFAKIKSVGTQSTCSNNIRLFIYSSGV